MVRTMRAVIPVRRVIGITATVIAIAIRIAIAAVTTIAVADAQASVPAATRVAVDAAIGRAITGIVIFDRRTTVVIVTDAVAIGVIGDASAQRGSGECGDGEMTDHGGVPCVLTCSIGFRD